MVNAETGKPAAAQPSTDAAHKPHTGTADSSCADAARLLSTTSSGHCYAPGEYCPNADHGISGIAGNGEAIICEDNNGWRWEPR